MPLLENNRFSMLGLERSLEVDGHASPFDKLPVEIIQQIFSFTYTDVYFPPINANSPLLNLVCKKWLDIATKHHSLWATFTILLESWGPRSSSKLQTVLQKSGSHPLRIAVAKARGMDEVVLEVLDAIIGHSERWESIALYFPLEIQFLRKLNAVQDRLPLLQYLHFTGPRDQYPAGTQHSTIFNLRSVPSLTHISLEDTYDSTVHTVELPWTQLSRVDLDVRSFRTIRSRLPLSQHLTTLRLHQHLFQSVFRKYDNTVPPIQLQNLQELHVIAMGGNIADLICPSLKRLLLHLPSTFDVPTFLDNSSCRLIDIELIGHIEQYFSHASEIYTIIRHPSLENLRSLSLKYFDLNTILDILLLDGPNMVPFLETLNMDVTFFWRHRPDFESQIEGLVRVVESRTHAKRADGSLLENHNSDVAPKICSFLKEFSLILTVNAPTWSEWEDMKLKQLRSVLISRNVSQTIRLRKRQPSQIF